MLKVMLSSTVLFGILSIFAGFIFAPPAHGALVVLGCGLATLGTAIMMSSKEGACRKN